MNKQKALLLILTLVLIGGSAAWLAKFHSNQNLGRPGVKTSPIADSIRLKVDLPENVLDYTSEWIEPDSVTLGTLPQDTSFGERRYTAPDGFMVLLNVVLMGGDRSSLHKPQFCLSGSGWIIDDTASSESKLRIGAAAPYDLPVVKLVCSRQDSTDNRRGIYVYWYVADGAVSAGTLGLQRMWWMARDLIRTGTLQRWAYVSCFSACMPGQEEATFERMKKLLVSAVPEFQKPPNPGNVSSAARP